MLRIAIIYGLGLAAAALLLAWIDHIHMLRQASTEFYVTVIALSFALLGGWMGYRLTPRPRGGGFVQNHAAMAALGISQREEEVLQLLAKGDANKVIARKLAISPHTVKTHIGNLLVKLDAGNRTQAISKARELDILP
jgi:DNA-binding NarL/FixJ family response regulator